MDKIINNRPVINLLVIAPHQPGYDQFIESANFDLTRVVQIHSPAQLREYANGSFLIAMLPDCHRTRSYIFAQHLIDLRPECRYDHSEHVEIFIKVTRNGKTEEKPKRKRAANKKSGDNKN